MPRRSPRGNLRDERRRWKRPSASSEARVRWNRRQKTQRKPGLISSRRS
ncbi:hypothetical protein PPTG_24122 [Phytophthora nicotianae INRA-310]|uniref:Uncharacterized protein n=1 Tax=Phytophthora nicotianae (strain INRA-310) TaxID=761204 RepID=W2PL84_PHYN3|nr:hypothetical protein PPTG_24122 [Phytophthora nicotianae INRA-310]ETN01019.1 hypothetical protein PPTG_24122 [Phytophthora nicotianae INRA-310]